MDVEAFITRWTAREGGAERANYQMFLAELCRVLGVQEPEVSGADVRQNDYVFERAVRPRESDGGTAPKRIDLYKKNAFILEAKQSRMPGGKNAIPTQQSLLPAEDLETLGRRTRGPAWDVMMQNARKQAEGYVFLLDADQPAPPFIITCDVGHCLELFADFTGTGRAYNQFPDRNGFRIYMDDLRDAEVRARLAQVWTDPHALDPTRTSARVTNEIAKRLAEVSKALEAKGCNAEDVAHFLMRCLFTMFAEDTDLLPKGSFCTLLEKSVADPSHFQHRLKALWREMETGAEFSPVIDAKVRHFNGGLFKDTTVFELGREEIGELLGAARANWKLVDPAIFGTLLEQALDKDERRRLGAHYTPRAYVQRLVDVTVMEPLREDWQTALKRAAGWRDLGDAGQAVTEVKAFHHKLCTTRVLDPACGTGNFLYVALEMMKQLEGEVLQALTDMGERQASLAMTGEESVDPHQFLGLELNPRAAAIAELVIWIGYLQWHYRNYENHPAEPILRAFSNINFGRREGYDAVLTWDGYPVPGVAVGEDGVRRETYPNARRPAWPEAEFIVGNPPFIGGKDLRSRMVPGYAEALWAAHPQMNESADFVMYWWDRAAEIVARKKSLTRRFGLVTTNSISQVFQRRVIERHLNAKNPISLLFAISDHPWTKATRDSASVRIGMTVAGIGSADGLLLELMAEASLDTDEPKLVFSQKTGRINSDLTVGTDVTKVVPLLANQGVCSPGVKLHGAGFILTQAQARHLGLGTRAGLERHVRPYRNGRDLTATPRDAMVIDLFGLTAENVRREYPEVYQHLSQTVKMDREAQVAKSPTKDAISYRDAWWIFGKPRSDLRQAISPLRRYIATVETAKHRLFQFLDVSILPDNRLVCFALSGGDELAVLSARIHKVWALTTGGTLEDRPIYTKSQGFDPFPFPNLGGDLAKSLSALGEELDSTRKLVLAEHPDLTLTGLYNLIEKVKAGAELTPAEEDAKQRGRVLILKELHEQIDALTAQAYGWPADLSDEEILARLVALNAERAKEEAAGHVRWLRPDYQIPRFARGATAKTGELDLGDAVAAIDKALPPFPKDPAERPVAVAALLMMAARPMDAAELARGFKGGGKRVQQGVVQALTTLVRYGWVTPLGDGRFAARRAA
ncbi:class I SAM-dependent DNA methyltransferase [Phenylobacterium sp.]|uniref:class I SAM-dependent DNA methyltransferase n=1 Tax=Phenylobacterium sp. TaxID=1871053 RepID=UPI0037C51461